MFFPSISFVVLELRVCVESINSGVNDEELVSAKMKEENKDNLARATEGLTPLVTISWSYLVLASALILGVGMSITGYIGCFAIVGDPASTAADVYIWLGLEFALTLLRVGA